MLFELLVNLIFGLAKLLISMIPDMTFDSGFVNIFSDVAQIIDGASYVLPMGTFAFCLGVFFLLHNAALIISILNWVIRKIPGVA